MTSQREIIIDITASLFHYQGYNKTGINQIIDEAKDNLCVELLNYKNSLQRIKY